MGDTKDEDRFIDAARRYLNSGNIKMAELFAHKAVDSNPSSTKVKELLRELNGSKSSSGTSSSSSHTSNTESSQNGYPRHRNTHRQRGSSDEEEESNSYRTHAHSEETDRAVPNSVPNRERDRARASAGSSNTGSTSYSYTYTKNRECLRPETKQASQSPSDQSQSSREQNTASTSSPSESSPPSYTQEQLEDVRRIRRCHDFYEILQVEKSVNEEDIKRSYRKLAMKLHPDKNKAPGSTEAFRAVSNAFYVLSDEGRRRQYDASGSSGTRGDHSTFREQNLHRHTRRHHGYGDEEDEEYEHYDYSRGFEANISAEDIFNMFFGGPLNPNLFRNGHVQRSYHQHQQAGARVHRANFGSNSLLWIQLAPLVILFVLSFFTMILRSEPLYSLSRSQHYTEERHTNSPWKVSYFVRPPVAKGSGTVSEFDEQYPYGSRALRQVEEEIEGDYYSGLANSCYREENYRAQLIYRARWMRDADSLKHAESMSMPHCEELARLRRSPRNGHYL